MKSFSYLHCTIHITSTNRIIRFSVSNSTAKYCITLFPVQSSVLAKRMHACARSWPTKNTCNGAGFSHTPTTIHNTDVVIHHRTDFRNERSSKHSANNTPTPVSSLPLVFFSQMTKKI